MPTDVTLKTMNALHRGLMKVTFGKVGWSLGKMPVLELTTVGRKSGQKRTSILTSPIQKDGAYVVVASRGGDDTHPAWFLNLRDNPDVEVTLKGKRRPMTARVATADERAEMWPRITTDFKTYAGYQEKTDREIPLVWLEPKP